MAEAAERKDERASSHDAVREAARKAREAAGGAIDRAGPALSRAAVKARAASAKVAEGAASLAREVSADITKGVSAVKADLAARAERKRARQEALAKYPEAPAASEPSPRASALYPDEPTPPSQKSMLYPDAPAAAKDTKAEGDPELSSPRRPSAPADKSPNPGPSAEAPLAGNSVLGPGLRRDERLDGSADSQPLASPPPDPPLTSALDRVRRYRPIDDDALYAEKPSAPAVVRVKADPPVTAAPGVLRATTDAPKALTMEPSAEQSKGKTKSRAGGAPPPRRGAVFELFLLAASLAFAGIIGVLFAGFVLIAPRVEDGADLWAVNRMPSIVILDRNGEELAARGARYGQAVAVDELPDYLVKAILATEDRRFYEHMGVDLRGMGRALLTNLRRGGVVEGGSTITQQLARNLFLSPEQTYIRKAREAMLAFWIEGRYTKDQILSLYLNRIYFGAGAFGVEQAARTYFNKSAREVTLAEAVMLAGLPKAPSSLAPTLNPEGAQERASAVLDNLRETGAITEFEAREAKANPPRIADAGGEYELGWFFDYIAAEARTMAKGREGDLTVTTTLDKNIQRQAVAAVKAGIDTEAQVARATQAALVAYDVDGSLLAMVGGLSYVESQFNRAVQAKRQPGSAFKPFVYTAALEAGLEPTAIFVDQPITIGDWTPSNYTPGFQGRMRLTEAVAKSVNTIAVQVSEAIGRERVVEMAERLGIKTKLDAVPSIALGGVSVTLEELTAAYLPLANDGMASPPHAIERIEDQNLEIVYQRRAPQARRVLDPKVSEGINHLLFQVMNSGTGAGARLGSRVAVGKTGTTNDWRDAWFVGYTAQIVAGVWVGNDEFEPMKRITGGQIPAKIWKNFMIAAHQDMPALPIKGAYPARTFGVEDTLISFYTDVLNGFNRVRRDRD
jgi:penicillin-binding protein 1A